MTVYNEINRSEILNLNKGKLMKIAGPNSSTTYRFYPKGGGHPCNHVDLTEKQLLSASEFRLKLFNKTGCFVPLSKQKDWKKHASHFMKNCQEVNVHSHFYYNADLLIRLASIINQEINYSSKSNDFQDIKSCAAIVRHGKIILTLQGINSVLKTYRAPAYKRNELTKVLSALGFKKKTINTGDVYGNLRAWGLSKEAFNKKMSQIIKKEMTKLLRLK